MPRMRDSSDSPPRQTPNRKGNIRRGLGKRVGAAAASAALALTGSAAAQTPSNHKGAARVLAASVPDATLTLKNAKGKPDLKAIDQITGETALPSVLDTARAIAQNGQIPQIVVQPEDLYIPSLKYKSPKSIAIEPTTDSDRLAGSLNRQFSKYGVTGLRATTSDGIKEVAYRDTSFKDEFDIALGGILTVRGTNLKPKAAWMHARGGTLDEVTGQTGIEDGVKRLASREGDEQIYVIPRDPMPGEVIPIIPELPEVPQAPADPGPPGQLV